MTSSDSDMIARYSADVGSVVSFLGYTGSPLYSREYFNWKIANNPFGGAAAYLRFRDGVPAAHCSITAKPANEHFLPGSTLGELGDTHTNPGFQRQGHFAALGAFVIDDFQRSGGERPALIYGLPNEQALPGWTRSIGCQVYDTLGLVEMVRSPSSGMHPARILASFGRFLSGSRRFDQKVLNPLDDVDQIWAACDRSRWLVRKNGEWVNWRYLSSPGDYEVHVLRDAAGDARAWVATKTTKTGVRFGRRVDICDIVGRTVADEAAALAAYVTLAPRIGDLVSGWFQPDGDTLRLLRRLGFRIIRTIPVIFADNEAFAAARAQPIPRFSLGDGDTV